MKTKIAVICALLLGMMAAETREADTSTNPVVLIYTTVGYPPPGETNLGPWLVVALWKDSKIIWSERRIAGGPPYFQGQYDPKKLDELLGKLESQGAWTNTTLRRAWFGPDAKTTRIIISNGSHRLAMESWHELYEQHSNTVATAQGLTSLNGRNRGEVLRGQPEDYRQFRNTWSEIRGAVAELIPAKGEPYNDTLPAMKW